MVLDSGPKGTGEVGERGPDRWDGIGVSAGPQGWGLNFEHWTRKEKPGPPKVEESVPEQVAG